MKEEWLFPSAVVPVDVETTAALVAEIHRLIGVVGNMALAQASQEPVAWEQFYPDIGKPEIAFNAEVVDYVAPQRTWVGLTDEEKRGVCRVGPVYAPDGVVTRTPLEYRKELQGVALMAVRQAEAKLKEKNT